MAAPTNNLYLTPIQSNVGACEGNFTPSIATLGATGDVYYMPTLANNGLGISFSAPSTGAMKLQASTDTRANVKAGTALWADVSGATSTGGTVYQGTIAYPVTALQLVVTTALAASVATIAIRTNSATGNN